MLVVDDSGLVRRVIQLMLASQPDFEVVGTARDGQECLHKAAELKPDAITLDINMPRMDGIEALRRLRETSAIPIVMVSALVDHNEELAMQLEELGASGIVRKNFSHDAIGVAAFEKDLLSGLRKALKAETT